MTASLLKRLGLAAVSFALVPGALAQSSSNNATILSSQTQKSAAQTQQGPVQPGADLVPPMNVETALKQAVADRKSGNLMGATLTLSQLVLASPDDPRVLGEYGKTLISEGRSDDALAFLSRAIQLQPGDWTLFSAQGIAYDQKADYQSAQSSYERALALKPGEPAVLSNAALSHMQAGDLDGAEKLLTQAALTGADNPRIRSNLALVQGLKAARQGPAQAQAQAQAQAAAAPAPAAVTPTSAQAAAILPPAQPVPAKIIP